MGGREGLGDGEEGVESTEGREMEVFCSDQGGEERQRSAEV